MQTKSLIHRHLAEAESALADINRQRDDLLSEIAFLRERVERHRISGASDPSAKTEEKTPGKGSPLPGSKRYRYEEAIIKYLAHNGQTHRTHILGYLREQGIIGDERDPLANISNILSTSDKFVSVGSGLWELASEYGNVSEPPDAKAAED
jgi:hypothetical protein